MAPAELRSFASLARRHAPLAAAELHLDFSAVGDEGAAVLAAVLAHALDDAPDACAQREAARRPAEVRVRLGEERRGAEDGLALSSRNQYLSASERAAAPLLWQTLQSCGAALTAKLPESPASIIDSAIVVLEQAGFIVDYLELRELSTLQLVDRVDQNCALFVAARLGDTRLIDNIQLAANN